MIKVSERELMVWKQTATGAPNKAIARTLNISEETVKVHIRSLTLKLNVCNRTKLAIKYFQANPGFVDSVVV